MSKPHAISKEDFGEFSPYFTLSSDGQTRRLCARVNLTTSRAFYIVQKRGQVGIATDDTYHSIDDAIAAYNDI